MCEKHFLVEMISFFGFLRADINESRRCQKTTRKGWTVLWVSRVDDEIVVKRSVPRLAGAGAKTDAQKLLTCVVGQWG